MELLSFLNSQLSFVEQLCLISIFALLFGSFASLLTHRLATDQAVVFARSECPKCKTPLKIRNLIPLFSWLFQRGKCSHCQSKISARYPLIELSFLIDLPNLD